MAMAAPQVAFPFNSQVPPVARVGIPFNFTFSDATFKPSGSKIQYSIGEGPAWLQFDASARTLWGTPGAADAITTGFNITASDATGSESMYSTIIVTADPAPTSSQDIRAALTRAGNMTGTNSLLVHPGQTFAIDFSTQGYAGNGKKLFFYSTLTDHTPLPSWMAFDARKLHYSGTPPKLSSSPQKFDMLLIASDVAGFAGVWDTFTVIVSDKTWAFEPEEQTINVATGDAVNTGALLSMLYLDGQVASASDLQHATAQVPPWLTFDPRTLMLTGTAPSGVKTAQVNITAYDHFGDSANLTLHLHFGSLLKDAIGPLRAYPGKMFEYTISRSDLEVSDELVLVDTGSASSWLHFDESRLRLFGLVPSMQTSTTINLNMTVTGFDLSEKDTSIIELHIQVGSAQTTRQTTTSALTQGSTAAAPSTVATDTTLGSIGELSSKTRGAIAAVVICPIFGVLAIILTMLYCCRAKVRGRKDSKPLSKSDISRPMVTPPDGDVGLDLEQGEDSDPIASEKPPQLDLSLHRANELRTPAVSVLRTPNRFKKRASSIVGRSLSSSNVVLEDGEAEALDGFNRSSWGYGSNRAPSTRPHDSMKIPTAMARVSKHASVRRSNPSSGTASQSRHRQSKGYQRLPGRGHGRQLTTRSSINRSDTLPGVGHGRVSTEFCPYCPNLRRESTMPLQTHAEVAESTYDTEALSMSLPTQSACSPVPTAWQARSTGIRPTLSEPTATVRTAKVEKSRDASRLSGLSSELVDHRSIIERRQSYIRHRAMMRSPFFGSSHDGSHGRKVSSTASALPSGLGVRNSQASLERTRFGRRFPREYSASSSLEPDVVSGRTRSKSKWKLSEGFPRTLGFSNPLSKTSSSLASALIYEDASEADWERRSVSIYSDDLASRNTDADAVCSSKSPALLTRPIISEIPDQSRPATDPPLGPLPIPPLPELPHKSSRRSMMQSESADGGFSSDESPIIEMPDIAIAVRTARLSQLSKEKKQRINKLHCKQKAYPDLRRSSIMERPRSSYRPDLATSGDSANRLGGAGIVRKLSGGSASGMAKEQPWEDTFGSQFFL